MDIVSRQRINILIHLSEIQSIESSSPEVSFIRRVAEECNFSKLDLATLVNSPEPIASFGALSPSQKKQYMYSICELMTLVEFNSHKKMLCQRVVYDLEYDSNQFNAILDKFQQETKSSQSNDAATQDQIFITSIA